MGGNADFNNIDESPHIFSRARDEEVDDIETGANYEFIKRQTLDGLKRHKSKYECMADMVVDPIPSDSSS